MTGNYLYGKNEQCVKTDSYDSLIKTLKKERASGGLNPS